MRLLVSILFTVAVGSASVLPLEMKEGRRLTPSPQHCEAPKLEPIEYPDLLGQVVVSGQVEVLGTVSVSGDEAGSSFQALGTETTVCGGANNARRWNASSDGGSFNCFGPFPYHEWFTK